MSEIADLDPAKQLALDELLATTDQDTQDMALCAIWDCLFEHEPAEAVALLSEIRERCGTELSTEDLERGRQIYEKYARAKKARKRMS